jgi:hypothetical protein
MNATHYQTARSALATLAASQPLPLDDNGQPSQAIALNRLRSAFATLDRDEASDAWSRRTLGVPGPRRFDDANDQPEEFYNVADLPADTYARIIKWLAARYVRDRTNANDANPLPVRELVARARETAADYLTAAIIRLDSTAKRPRDPAPVSGWQRLGIARHDHARLATTVAAQARRANWRTQEASNGTGRADNRARYPYIHGMSATGDNPAAILAVAESYARTPRRLDDLTTTQRGGRPKLTSPAPETLYNDARAQAVEAIIGTGETAGQPRYTVHATGGTSNEQNRRLTKTATGQTATVIVRTDFQLETACVRTQAGEWKRVAFDWIAINTTRDVPTNTYTMAPTKANSRTPYTYEPATVTADLPILDDLLTWNATHAPRPHTGPLHLMDGKVFQIRAEGGAWHTVDGEIVSTTHRPAPAPRPATPDTVAGYREIMTYQSSLPRSPYKDWNPADVARIAEAFRRSMHDQAARAWNQTIGTQAAQWWYDAASR